METIQITFKLFSLSVLARETKPPFRVCRPFLLGFDQSQNISGAGRRYPDVNDPKFACADVNNNSLDGSTPTTSSKSSSIAIHGAPHNTNTLFEGSRNNVRVRAGHQSNDTLQPDRTPSVRQGNRRKQMAMSRGPSMFQQLLGHNHLGRDNTFNNGIANLGQFVRQCRPTSHNDL